MNIQELRNRITLLPSGHGHYKIIYTTPYGRVKTGVTSDMQLIDRVKNTNLNDTERSNYGMTLKQALCALKSYTK